jgi:bifunctional DNase/RNase
MRKNTVSQWRGGFNSLVSLVLDVQQGMVPIEEQCDISLALPLQYANTISDRRIITHDLHRRALQYLTGVADSMC